MYKFRHLMKNSFVFVLALFVLASSQTAFSIAPSKSDLKKIGTAEMRIKATLKEASPCDKVIKVVYFHGSDQEPLAGWQERLPRTLADVSDYYREAFNRFGLKSKGLPFEKVKGEIVLHVIQGDSLSKSYNIMHGSRIQLEIARKSNGQINFRTDHVLVISGLCDQRADGTYFFHAPYHGTGSTLNGVCMVADCEKLDTRLLRDTVQKMTFSEMAVEKKTCSVAEFNSWYIGGIAHEMGHIFGLPHDFGGPDEFDPQHTSMMGEFGSRHFRDYLWKGEKSSEFSTASILQLMSHPLFTGYNVKLKQSLISELKSIDVEAIDSSLSILCKHQSNTQPYGVVALFRPFTQSEYLNRSYTFLPDHPDSIRLTLKKPVPGQYILRLIFLFPNSLTRNVTRGIIIKEEGTVELYDPIRMLYRADPKRLQERLLKQVSTPETEAKLNILKAVLNPVEPINLKTCSDSSIYLSDAKWENAKVGYEKPARNYFNLETEANFFLQLDGKFYSKGIYAHSTSSYTFDLDKKWNTFSATIGLRDNAHQQGSARFTVLGDGKVLYQSDPLRVDQTANFEVNVAGVKLLELKTEGTEGHNFNSWSIWVDPLLKK